jgi:hypothetical protein
MHRVLGASAFLAIALVMPVQDAGAQDPVGGAILGGAAGAIIGGAVRRRPGRSGWRDHRWCNRRCHRGTRTATAGGLPLLP